MENTSKPTSPAASSSIDIDIGNLSCFDINSINFTQNKESLEHLFRTRSVTAFNTIIDNLSSLPTQTEDFIPFVKLPVGTTQLPREKPAPKQSPLTKWQQYSRFKGIRDTKKSRKVWDEEAREWRPRWGYKRIGNEKQKPWLIELPQNSPAGADPFADLADKKRERVSKNELQRLRNVKRSARLPPANSSSNADAAGQFSHEQRASAFEAARRSTASGGRFDRQSATEKRLSKATKLGTNRGPKRKFESVTIGADVERVRQMRILDEVLAATPKVNEAVVEKAANRLVQSDQRERGAERRNRRGGGSDGKRVQQNKSRQTSGSGAGAQGGGRGGRGGRQFSRPRQSSGRGGAGGQRQQHGDRSTGARSQSGKGGRGKAGRGAQGFKSSGRGHKAPSGKNRSFGSKNKK